MKKVLVILGPTATGKTDLGLFLAKKFNGEIVSCDSRQVYVGLDISTGKLPGGKWKIENGGLKKGKRFWKINGVNIWMYDVVSLKRQYSVANYVRKANKIIEEIKKRGKLPIIVGGTGLYLKSILEGFSNLIIPVDKKLRKQLEKFTKIKLQEKLIKLSPSRWERLNKSDRENPRRLIRMIELSLSLHQSKSLTLSPFIGDDILKIGLIAPREILYKRVDERVLLRIQQGMVKEVERLYKNGLSFKRMRQLGLESAVIADYLEGKINSQKQLIKIIQGKIHGFIRRQLTWFKREQKVFWFDVTENNFNRIEKKVHIWYHSSNATKN